MKITTKVVYAINRLLKYICPLKILNTDDSIEYLLKNEVSLARYGDGELNIMMGGDIHFQIFDKKLAEHLVEILRYNNQESLKIGIPLAINTVEGYNEAARDFWNMNMDTGRMHWIRYCGRKKTFLNASLTRCYIDYSQKKISRVWFEKITFLWNLKKVLIVEGSESRLGVGNSLFSNTSHIGRIICPSTDAWSYYEVIFQRVKDVAENYDFVLVSLGPTATVLASEISKLGYRIIDIGHLNLEYNKYLEDGAKNIDLPITTEAEYNNQIVDRIIC